MLNFNHLYYFYVFAQERSVSKAARRLLISQPALSNQLKTFEQNLGSPLFTRQGRALGLTSAGELVFRHAQQVFAVCDDLERALISSRLLQERSVRFGVSDRVDQALAIDLVQTLLRERHILEDSRVTIRCYSFGELLGALHQNEVDIAISMEKPVSEDLEILRSRDLPINLVISERLLENIPDLPSDPRIFAVLDQHGIRFVMPTPDLFLHSLIMPYFARIGFAPRRRLEADLLSTLIRGVAAGLGAGLLPLTYFPRIPSEGGLRVLGPEEGFLQHPLRLFSRARRIKSGLTTGIASAIAANSGTASGE